MPTGLGHKAYLGLGQETTWGTPVARTKFLELVSGGDTLVVNEQKIISQGVQGIGVRGDLEVAKGAISVEGSLTVEHTYDGLEVLLKHAFGAVTSTQPNAAGDPTVWQHVFTIADALPTGLTIEVARDLTAFIHEGCKITGVEFSVGGPDELLRLVLEVLGEDVATGSPTSPTFPAVGRFNAPEAVLKWNTAALKVSQFSIKLDNKLDADRRQIGARQRLEPVRSGKIEVTGSFVAEFEDTTLLTDFRNATNRALQVKFTGPAIGVQTRTYEMTLDCNVSQITDYPLNVDDEGRITVEVAFRAFRNATDNELKVTLQNLTAGPV